MKKYKFEFLPQFHYLCVQNCVCQVLSYLGCKHPNQYMNCALEFCALSKYDELGYIPFIQRKMSDITIMSMQRTIKLKNVLSPSNAWRINKEILNEGKIFIAIVDVYYLYYRKEYNKIHGAHAVIVTEYDACTNMVYIVDCYEPYFFEGSIPLEDFFKARSSKNPKDDNPYSGWPIFNKWIDVEPDFEELPSEECLLKNINYTLEKKALGSCNDKLFGIDALKYLLDVTLEKKTNQLFWKNLHNEMFSIWRLCNLFFFNFSEVTRKYNEMSKSIKLFEEYNKLFQELLYVILKQSVKESRHLIERFQTVLNQFIGLTSLLLNDFEKIHYSGCFFVNSV